MLRFLKNRRVRWALGLVLALLAVALWPSATPVDVATALEGPLQVTVDEEGETRIHDRFVVSAPVAGRVLRIELEPGDAVKSGETVVATFLPEALDPRAHAEARAALAAAEAALGSARAEKRRAEAASELARAELERQRALFDQRIVSRETLDSVETQERSSREALEAAAFAETAAEHEADRARARLLSASQTGDSGKAKPLVLRSPVDGVVLRRHRESESVVGAGEPLLDLGDPRHLEIVSDLLSTDAVRVRPSQLVLIEQWGGEEALRGRVRLVEPSGFMKVSALGVEEQRVNVVIDFEDPQGAWRVLGDGYRVEVRIVVWEDDHVLKVPTGSLFRRGDEWAVFVLQGGRARLRAVRVGRRNGREAQILSGLEKGSRVVVYPGDTLRDGSRASPRTS
jgi:HlyD family secretion protein